MTALATSAHAEVRTNGGSRSQRAGLAALERYVEQHRTDWGLPGMTVCAVDRDGFTGFITSGWANLETREPVAPNHLFQIGSISKMIAALAIASLVESGKLSFDARLRDLMPELDIAGGEAITLQHLLDHTSGLPDDAPVFGEAGLWSGFEPGAHWAYSNTGYKITGLIAERADGRRIPDLLEALVLRPLGMNAAGAIRVGDRARYAQGYESRFNDRPNFRAGPLSQAVWVDFEDASGCVAATAADMAPFLRFLISLSAGHGAPILSDAAAARFLASPVDGWDEGAKYGNGVARLETDGRRYLHHTGGMLSFSSSLHVDVEAGVACFASTNLSGIVGYRPRDVSLHACRLLKAARDDSDAPSPPSTRSVVDHPERYARTFVAADGESFDIRAVVDQLKLRRGGMESDMQPSGGVLACRDPRFEVTGLVMEIENDRAVRVWAGDKEFVADPSLGYKPPAARDLQAMAGRYDSDDRWYGGPGYIYARDGKLWLNNTDALTPLADGVFRYGADDWSPERVRFDHVVAGRPMRLMFSGVPFVRRFS